MHIHTHTYTYIHIHTHTHTHTYMHAYIHTHRHTDIQTSIRPYIHIYIYSLCLAARNCPRYIYIYTYTLLHSISVRTLSLLSHSFSILLSSGRWSSSFDRVPVIPTSTVDPAAMWRTTPGHQAALSERQVAKARNQVIFWESQALRSSLTLW